jgi:hypothetical protein
MRYASIILNSNSLLYSSYFDANGGLFDTLFTKQEINDFNAANEPQKSESGQEQRSTRSALTPFKTTLKPSDTR